VLNLAFDTATPWGRFALAEGDDLLAYQPLNVSGSYADALLPVVDSLFQAAKRDLSEIGAIGVTRGPGSFTGIRIGVATAKGLAYGFDVPLIAVNTLEAMAAALLDANPDLELAVPVLDARRGELFAAVYHRAGAWVKPIHAPAARSPDSWWDRIISAVPDPDTAVWGGEGVNLLVGQGKELRPELIRRGLPVRRSWSTTQPATARKLALVMGDPQVDLPVVHPFALRPLYLRASDAEVKRHIDLTPETPEIDIQVYRGEPPEGGHE
jgi:tRNA threonylcarbamoyl adenosine modification protein YeaZ